MKIAGSLPYCSELPDDLLNRFPDDIFLVNPLDDLPVGLDISRCIGVVESISNYRLVDTLYRTAIPHIVQVNGQHFNEDLLLAASMIDSSDKFYQHGVLEVLHNESFEAYKIDEIQKITFTKKADKKALFSFFEKILDSMAKSNTVRSEITLVVDELFSNAIYNAPVQAEFAGEIQNRLENKNREYGQDKVGYFKFAKNESYFFVECMDPYGYLNPLEAFSRIRKSFQSGMANAINVNAGGAGIGSRLVYDSCMCYHMAINKGVSTNICCVIPYGVRQTKKEKYLKNINVLFSEGNMSDFSYKELFDGDKHIIKFSGHINEDSVLSGIDLSQKGEILFDFQEIVGVNSCGIREWIKWLKTLPATVKMTWINCPSEVIDQVNMVDGFLPEGAFIESFYIPYFCDECDDRINVLLKRAAGDTGIPEYEEETDCPNCNAKAEIDIIESKYLKFLKK